MTKRLALAGFVVVAAVACGSAEPGPAQPADQTDQDDAVRTEGVLEQATRELATMAQPASDVVAFETLQTLMPEVDDWNQSGVRGERTTAPMNVSRAEARYARGDGNVELEIVDAALSPMLLGPMSMFLADGFSERSADGFRQAVRIADSPAIEEWNSSSNRGEVTVVVRNRFVVQATGYDVDSLASVREVIDAVDFERLATLK